MLSVLFLWLFVFFILFIPGFSIVTILNRSIWQKEENKIDFDEYFFLGFLVITSVSGILSLFMPVNSALLWFVVLVDVVLYLLNFRAINSEIRKQVRAFTFLSKTNIVFLSLLVIFILTAIAQKITLLDTLSYHVQNIQWIRKYPVVPGLGNLHDRFAFNSMFFVVSALFTFKIKEALLFPLNGLCYFVLTAKLFSLYLKESGQQVTWKAIFYTLTLLISFVLMIPNLNTPSPDIICAVLIIYLFARMVDNLDSGEDFNFIRIIFLNLLVFTCVSFKLSSLFIVFSILLLMDRKTIRQNIIITLITSILIFLPFIIRNYYLSGYLIYPFPAIDIFNVDWKIPFANVTETKSVIEGWAKIPLLSYHDVLNMKFSEWIFPWLKQLNFYSKLIIALNFISVFTFVIMLFRKEFSLAKIQFVIIINLLFWFLNAPDPRFAYGFLFAGFSLTIAYIIKIIMESTPANIDNYIRAGLLISLFIIAGRRIKFPVETIKDPSVLIIPSSFGTVDTRVFSTNFSYRIPIDNQECYNTDIPCVTYQLNNVFLRGNDLHDGFKVVDRVNENKQ